MKIERRNIFKNLFDGGGNVPEFITSIKYKTNNDLLYKSSGKPLYNKNKGYSVNSLSLIPDYINLMVDDCFKYRQVIQVNEGYASDLNGFNTVEEYVRTRFKKNSGQVFKRIKRLESCLNISYKKYYGEISKEQYNFLMASLKTMPIRRFDQRNDDNDVLKSWDELNDSVYGLILAKKASIFVICNNNDPIQISIQYHFDRAMHGAIPAYDIDYQKFTLGYIAIYEQIAWCLENNYLFFDQGYGDLEYKRRWSNYIYNYKHQIFYNNKSVFSIISGNFEFIKISFKEYLKSKKIDKLIEKIKNKIFKRNNNELKPINHCNYEILELDNIASYYDLEETDFLNHSVLKKITIDFLYSAIEHIDAISVFKVLSEKNTFVIKSKNKTQKIFLK